MVIHGVSFDVIGKQPIVLLRTSEGSRFLPIWIGHPEAAAILMKLRDSDAPRPMTHDLLATMLGELGAEVVGITVTELRESTFYARITLRSNGSTYEVDSRPSDAIALAVRTGAPIFAADEVIAESGIEIDEESEERMGQAGGGADPATDDPEGLVSDFRDFLDEVRPDQFEQFGGADEPEKGA
jgi:bifunctional DNase/RNase